MAENFQNLSKTSLFLNKQQKTTQTASDGENFKSLFLLILKFFQTFKNIMLPSNMS